MKLEKFKKIIQEASPASREEVRLALDIQDRLHELLALRFDGKQKLLAEKMGVSEAVVSKWFSGVQNFTISTIAKLSVAFGEPIVGVLSNADHNVTFEKVTIGLQKETRQVEVNEGGQLCEVFVPVKMDRNKNGLQSEFAA